MPTQIDFPMPDDWHVHVRDGAMMKAVLPFSVQQFCNNLYMPNLTPPLKSVVDIVEYRKRLQKVSGNSFANYADRMTMYLTHETTGKMISDAAKVNVTAVKFYPQGGTTNSTDGLPSPREIKPSALKAMEKNGLVLCLHGEVTADQQPDPLLREYDFIPHLEWLVEHYPRLKIVVEHVSDRRMLQRVLELPGSVAATITAHHPFLTHFDAEADPHCSCMPIAKTYIDKEYLSQIILEAHKQPKIFFGSDSAPHLEEYKLSGSFGIWSSPVAIPVMWQHFDDFGGRDKWESFVAFMCHNGAAFYGATERLRPSLTLTRERWQVPAIWKGVVPYKAGEVLEWRVEGMKWFGSRYTD